MKVDNKTDWRTDQLKAIIMRVAKEELDPKKAKRVTIQVYYTKRRARVVIKKDAEGNVLRDDSGHPIHHRIYEDHGSCGYAYLRGFWCRVGLGRDTVDKPDFAKVVAHEFAHLRGMRHGAAMNCKRYKRVPGYRDFYAWANDMPLEKKPKKEKPKGMELREQKLHQAEQQVKVWEKRIKRAETWLRKWKKKVTYHKRQLRVAAAKTKPKRPILREDV
jgi:hypothetical protein